MVLRVRPATPQVPTNIRWTTFSFERALFFPFIALLITGANCVFAFLTASKLLFSYYFCAPYELPVN